MSPLSLQLGIPYAITKLAVNNDQEVTTFSELLASTASGDCQCAIEIQANAQRIYLGNGFIKNYGQGGMLALLEYTEGKRASGFIVDSSDGLQIVPMVIEP